MTGVQTCALPISAVLLGAHARENIEAGKLAALENYSRAIGLAFQVTDDILDVEGKAETLGKNPGMDRVRGKSTYPQVLGLIEAKVHARELLTMALESLAPLGDNGGVLAELAGFIIERRQ